MSESAAGRIRRLSEAPLRPEGAYVLYWMTATRRLGWSFALDHAVDVAERLGRPLLILEALNAGYPWAADRHHQAIMDGMSDHAHALAEAPVGYYPYVEPSPGAGHGLLAALADQASCVITDDSPVFFTPKLMQAAAQLEGVRVEAVDSVGLLPIREAGRSFSSAYDFRRYLHRSLHPHLSLAPRPDPFDGAQLPPFLAPPESVLERWPPASMSILGDRNTVARLPIDHSVSSTGWRGGQAAARARLKEFVEDGLERYGEDRNHPDRDGGSRLSPWLHYGHLSPHEVFHSIAAAENWAPARLSERADGRRSGWWNMSASAEAFLDQLITWRELGMGYAVHVEDYTRYETLPDWARQTLEDHAVDHRPHRYTHRQFEAAETHDELWNAAQRQLVLEGRIHNYLRMLWGKKILEWTDHPREALDLMVDLNNRYALDGRDPNSYSGIFWVLGRFDRGWPRRPVFGTVRSMSSEATRRKVRVTEYVQRWGPEST